MNTLPHIIPLYRGATWALADRLAHIWQRLQSAWAVHRARRDAEEVQHELGELDPRALQDIGAPQGLAGQRRWQEELRETHATERLLDLRGW